MADHDDGSGPLTPGLPMPDRWVTTAAAAFTLLYVIRQPSVSRPLRVRTEHASRRQRISAAPNPQQEPKMTRSLFEIAPSMRIGIGLPTSAHPKSHPCGRRPLMLAGAAALLALAACGGGGGGDNAGEPQYAVRTAMGYWLNAPASWTLQGSVAGGQKYTVKITSAPLPPGPVPIVGGTAARSLQMYSAEVDGVTIDGGPTFYFDSTSLSFIGSDNGTGTCSVVTANTALPSAATVGSSGAVYTDSDYDSCASGATVVATTKSTWSLEANAGIVMLCWKMTALDLGGGELATQSTCIEVAQDGTLGGKARLAVTASGITLIDARNF